jgi:hypothetical protein
MNRKQFLLILSALAIIGGAGLVLLNHHRESWSVREAKMGDKVLPDFNLNQVATIHVKGSSDVHIVRASGSWRVREREEFPANYQQIKDCLIRMRELKVVQSEPVGPAQLPRVELEEPGKGPNSGTLIEFMDGNGKVLNSLCVGKRHVRPQDPSVPPGLHGIYDGRYVMLPKEPGNVLLISDELANVSSEPGAWLSRDFIKVEHIQSVSFSSGNAASSWRLTREKEEDPWSLADLEPAKGEALDAGVAAQIGELVPFLAFLDVVPKATGSGKAPEEQAMLTVQTFDHLSYIVRIGPKRLDGNYLVDVSVKADQETPDNREKFAKESRLTAAPADYVIEARIIEALIRDRPQLLEKKSVASEHSPINNPSPLTITQ